MIPLLLLHVVVSAVFAALWLALVGRHNLSRDQPKTVLGCALVIMAVWPFIAIAVLACLCFCAIDKLVRS